MGRCAPPRALPREKALQLAAAHQADLAHQRASLILIGTGSPPAPAAPAQHRDAQLDREPMPGRSEEVGLHREPEVGRLHPVDRRQPAYLGRHCGLPLERFEVLDHRVAEHHVEGAIGQLTQACGVTGPRLDVLVHAWLGLQVDQHHPDVAPADQAALLPERVGPPDVEDAHGAAVLLAKALEDPRERFEAARPPRVRERAVRSGIREPPHEVAGTGAAQGPEYLSLTRRAHGPT